MEQEEQSLITDEHRSWIGKKSEPITVTVSEKDAHRMRDVLEDSDPRWADDTGLAPPYVLAQMGGRRPGQMPQILPGGLLTQQEWTFERPFKIGEKLTGYSEVIDIRERLGGRYGHSVLVTSATRFSDTDGNPVASAMLTITQFDPRRAQGGNE